jgi:hypothetical protein
MHLTRAPLVIDDAVRALARSIRADRDPLYLSITACSQDVALDCFNNVRRRIDRDGGALRTGWAIWEWPRVYVEAEHHAVWEDPEGALYDITPGQTPNQRRRLFLDDDLATYDFDNPGILRDNQRLALSDSTLVPAFFAAAAERTRILNLIPGVGAVSTDLATARLLEAATTQVARLQAQIAMTHTPARAPCFCGGRKLFKQCHGRRPFRT